MLIEDLLTTQPHLTSSIAFDEGYYRFLKEAVVVLNQNIYDYIKKSVAGTRIDKKHIPNVMPPFDVMWFESNRTGVSLITIREDDGSVKCIAHMFLKDKEKGSEVGFYGRARWSSDKNGECSEMFEFAPSVGVLDEQSLSITASYFTFPVWMTLSFMHCKNVSMKTEFDPSVALNKKRSERNLPPLLKKYTLEIEPMKKIIRETPKDGMTDIHHALHICRGHFKNFSEKPLFGKHKGTYWWPMQTRGSKEYGEIKKDYEVKI